MYSEDLLDLWQGAIEPLKKHLDWFDKLTVLVEDHDENFFVKAFMKGMKNDTFFEALSI